MEHDRRSQILRAASELLATGGVKAVTVRAVAHHAGIGPSTLRHYFATQNALLDALFRSRFQHVGSDLRLADTSAPAVDRLAECVEQFLPTSEQQLPVLTAWLDLYQGVVGRGEHLGIAIGVMTDESYAMVNRWLDTLRAQGESLRDDPDAAARLLSRVDGVCLGLLNPGSPIDIPTGRRLIRQEVEALWLAPAAAEAAAPGRSARR